MVFACNMVDADRGARSAKSALKFAAAVKPSLACLAACAALVLGSADPTL